MLMKGRMLSILLAAALLFAVCGPAAAKSDKKVKRADKETVKMVKTFLKVPIKKLPLGSIEPFLAIDPESLPRRFRRKYKSRRLELNTLRHLAKSKKRGFIRRPTLDCEPGEGSKTTEPGLLKFAGYVEISEEEEGYVLTRTGCTELDLMCEFSLQIIIEEKKGRRKRRRLYLHSKDPLNAFVSEYRQGRGARQSKFFGISVVKCKH